MRLLGSAIWDAEDIVARWPPHHRHRNKRVVQEIACPPGSTLHGGQIRLTRWSSLLVVPPMPAAVPGVLSRPGYFQYERPEDGRTHWHLNFADRNLFGFWHSDLFAQDEMQVAEHPVLASVRPAMEAAGIEPLTEDVQHGATPVLLMGVERRCAIDTAPGPGKPRGLYGNRFAEAEATTVLAATRRIDPPTISNLIAMAAPSPRTGQYTQENIQAVLLTATTGFTAAVRESDSPVVIHTGFWGCGAFGGHRVLMTLLQLLAARMAGVSDVHIHYGEASGAASVAEAIRIFGRMEGTTDVVETVAKLGFEWGQSDGN